EPWAQHVAPGLDLPRLRWAGDAAGTLTARAAAEVPGLRAGIPVITGTIDAWAASVSGDATRPGEAMLMYGPTASLAAPTRAPTPAPGPPPSRAGGPLPGRSRAACASPPAPPTSSG